jgi:hypothetical protein
MFGRSEGGGRRIARRLNAALPALLITMSDRHPAILYNISETGAQVRARDAPTIGTELFLQVGDLDVYGKVVWKNGEECGIKFESRISQWDVEQLRGLALKGDKAKFSAAEKGGADDWDTGVAR